MFFDNEDVVVEVLGVFKIIRGMYQHRAINSRCYDSLSVRTSGSGVFISENTEIRVGTSDITYIPQKAEYMQTTDGEEIIAVHFVNYGGRGNSSIEVAYTAKDENVVKLVKDMHHIWSERRPGYKQKCTSMLYELIYIGGQYGTGCGGGMSLPDRRLCAAEEYIHKNYKKENILISHLAEICYMSQTYFRELFKEKYGITPNKYIMDLKLEYAQSLLLSRYYTVLEVSEKAGFSDVKYFGRMFKNKYGVSPGKYRYEKS